MNRTMRAAVYHGRGDVRIEEVARSVPGADDVLVRVLRTGLCGTDATEWAHGPVMTPVHERHPHSGHLGPLILGHEMVGEIVAGPDDSELRPGTIAACGAQVACGDCATCEAGRSNVCQRLYTLGLQAHGGLAEYVSGPARYWVPVPEGVPLDAAGLAQPLAVGIHAARRSGAVAGDSVLVTGAGAIGTFVLAGLRHLVPEVDITVADVDPVRLDRARRLGADRAVDASAGQEPGVGAYDVVVEASGAPGLLAAAVRCARSGGRVLAVGMAAEPEPLDSHEFVLREVTIESSNALITAEDIPASLEILRSGGLATELVDSVRGLEDVAATLEELAGGRLRGKVLIDPRR